MTFDQWTLETIRYDKSMMSWLEERRHEWLPLAQDAILKLLEGYTLLVLTDDNRDWFATYILSKLNNSLKNRPFLPVYKLKTLYPNLRTLQEEEEIELLFDMLSISFGERFFIWYIGNSTSSYLKIAMRCKKGFFWIMDKEVQNGFTLRSYDELLDIKLLQLFRLFDKSIDVILFGEVEV
ncbi:MAG: hypothetical protein GXO61_04940 [Epsilonproteobacteria bacterium]|nr:hypothetical protein [Campylobacterota bacterium]